MAAVREWKNLKQRPGDEIARLLSVRIRQSGKIADTVDIRFPIEVEITYEALKDDANLLSSVAFHNEQGVHLFMSADLNDPIWSQYRRRGIYRSVCCVAGNLFAEGVVRVTAEVATRTPVYRSHFIAWDCAGFQVLDSGQPGSVRSGWARDIPGLMRPMCEWSTESISANSPHFPLQEGAVPF
jgi:lipopolysaccharide transport system ATP-binding protein